MASDIDRLRLVGEGRFESRHRIVGGFSTTLATQPGHGQQTSLEVIG